MILYVVGKIFKEPDWEIIGIYDDKAKAEAVCTTRRMFVGPFELNKTIEKDHASWPGAYFPKSK